MITAFIIFSNGVGRDDNEVRTGNAMILDPYGDVLAETWQAGDDMVLADLKAETRAMCTGVRWIRSRRPELYKDRVHAHRARTGYPDGAFFHHRPRGKQPEIRFSIPWQKPEPDPIDPNELPALAQATMADAKFPMLASLDGDRPRLRPVSPVKTDGFIVYVANLKAYHKTQEIAANPNVELCYMDNRHDQVRITGRAEVLDDADAVQSIWDSNPLLRQYLGTSIIPC